MKTKKNKKERAKHRTGRRNSRTGVYYTRKESKTAPAGLDKSCYVEKAKHFIYVLWHGNKRLGYVDSEAAAKDAVKLIERGAALLPANKCKADGASLRKGGALIPTGFTPCIFPK